MARPQTGAPPKYCRHKRTNRGYVTLQGKQHSLPGAYGSTESREAYHALLRKWELNDRKLPELVDGSAPSIHPTIAVLCANFWKHCEHKYLDRNQQPTGEAANFRYAIRPLIRMYGTLPIHKFSTDELITLRSAMLMPQTEFADDGTTVTRPGWSREYANRQVSRIRRIFRWGTLRKFQGEKLVPSGLYSDLMAIEGLAVGEEGARETDKITAVALDVVEKTLPHLPPPVGAMVWLQMLSGARGGELFKLTTGDIDRSGKVWKYRPAQHKTSKKGKKRVIFFGPRSQIILTPLLKLDPHAPLFCPADAHAWRNARAAAARKTPLTPSQRKRAEQAAKIPRALSPTYNKRSYAQAIARAAERAEVTHWHPHQLRHLAGKTYRDIAGFESAKVMMGHTKDDMTSHYAEVDELKGEAAALRIG